MEYSPRLAQRMAAAIARIAACDRSEILACPLSAWLVAGDTHVPQSFLPRPVQALLNLTYDELFLTRQLGNVRIEKLIRVLERVGADPDSQMGANSERRFLEIKSRISERRADPAFLERRVSSWVLPTDRGLPQEYLSWPLSNVLASPYERLVRMPGIGVRRIQKLLDVLERSCGELPPARVPLRPAAVKRVAARPTIPPAEQRTAARALGYEITPAEWRDCCELIRTRGLEKERLGRYAASLNELPVKLWTVSLGEYTALGLYEIHSRPNHGPIRLAGILAVYSRIAAMLRNRPADSPIPPLLSPPLLQKATRWAESISSDGTVPTVRSIRADFLDPLLRLIESDSDAVAATMTRRRLELDGPKETLDAIAVGAGLTRERVRQIVARSAYILQIRWPEGRRIVRGIHSFLRASPGADEQARLVDSILKTLFAGNADPVASRPAVPLRGRAAKRAVRG